MKKLRDLVLAVLLAYLIPLASSVSADAAIGTFQSIDPDGVFAWRFLHHIVQALLVGIVIFVLSVLWKRPASEWGLNLNQREWSLDVTWKFCIGCVVYSLIVAWLSISPSGVPSAIDHDMTARNVAGNLLFLFTMPGISEELLFRALIMTVLSRSWGERIRVAGLDVPSAGFIAAILFALAHVGFTLVPFKITYLDPMQVGIAFAFGIFHAIMYDRTKSLLGPVLVHNASDGILATISYIVRIVK